MYVFRELEYYRKDGLVWFEILTETFISKQQQVSQNLYEALSSLAKVFENEVFRSISQRLMTRLQEVSFIFLLNSMTSL